MIIFVYNYYMSPYSATNSDVQMFFLYSLFYM